MRKLRIRGMVCALALPLVSACAPGVVLDSSTEGTDSSTGPSDTESGGTVPTGFRPFRGACEMVIDQPFPFLDASGAPQIASLSIGGTSSSANFANRGDVVVEYADTDRITVEMCPFTMASSDPLAEDEFSKLHIWAYDASGSPRRPDDMDADDDCVDASGTAPWRHDCRIRVWFNGQAQPVRSGADLRVTLPSGYPFALKKMKWGRS